MSLNQTKYLPIESETNDMIFIITILASERSFNETILQI